MPKYVNQFKAPEFVEETIVDANGGVIGTIRVKPSSVLWRPKSAHKFLSVPLEKFAAWISSAQAGAKSAKK